MLVKGYRLYITIIWCDRGGTDEKCNMLHIFTIWVWQIRVANRSPYRYIYNVENRMNKKRYRIILSAVIGGLLGILIAKHDIRNGRSLFFYIKYHPLSIILIALLFGIMAVRAFIQAGKKQ